MRRTLLAGAAALALLGWQAPPARADIFGGIGDTVGGLFGDVGDGLGDIFALIVTIADNLPANNLLAQLEALFRTIGTADNSYLPNGANLDTLYPAAPDYFSPDDAAQQVAARYADRRTRVEEAMSTASQATIQIPQDQTELDTLRAMNVSPVSIFAALQIGNQINLKSANVMERLTAVTAELGQLEADQRMQEDWSRQMAEAKDRQYYGPAIQGAGTIAVEPDVIATNW